MLDPMVKLRAPQGGVTKVLIDFGTGTRALKHFKQLDGLLPHVIQLLKEMDRSDAAERLRVWQVGVRYICKGNWRFADTWVIELTGNEWSALSLGLRNLNRMSIKQLRPRAGLANRPELRALGTKGRTLYAWLTQGHIEYEYADGYRGGRGVTQAV